MTLAKVSVSARIMQKWQPSQDGSGKRSEGTAQMTGVVNMLQFIMQIYGAVSFAGAERFLKEHYFCIISN